jgi:hypothetical protein
MDYIPRAILSSNRMDERIDGPCTRHYVAGPRAEFYAQ